MPAYVNRTASLVLESSDKEILAELQRAYASDGFATQYTAQTMAWSNSLPLLKRHIADTIEQVPDASQWLVLLEFPLYRLRRRIDAVVVTDHAVVILELKVGEHRFLASDRRQVEEYALDLRDFHEPSAKLPLLPALWCTEAESVGEFVDFRKSGVSQVQQMGRDDLGRLLVALHGASAGWSRIAREEWPSGAYKPVPTVIEAATTLFAGHGVREIAQADASNLSRSAECIVSIIDSARTRRERALIFLTGVPGSGKTLAGLQVVHRTAEINVDEQGDIVYLSGNTPLVTVIREALAQDEHIRRRALGEKVQIASVRRAVRARIQHIIDFLKEYLTGDARAPHEHAIVFDEAQRAWDERYGARKFGRTASEPRLLLELMSRHDDWCALIGLIGGGQEIHSGENGLAEWGDALRSLPVGARNKWTVYGPPGVIVGARSTAFLGLGDLPPAVKVEKDDALRLQVPVRSFRSPLVAEWVAAVIEGSSEKAARIAGDFDQYPVVLTRELETARRWLQSMARGERRFGLVANSGASRLRAEGLGVSLHATDGIKIAHWYLNPRDDVRSSFALEVTANEYTAQGLELDYVGLCWGGDLVISDDRWKARKFRGSQWVQANADQRRFIENSYRVLLTRAREGMVLWVPRGNAADRTRSPAVFDATATFLAACGAMDLDSMI